MLKIAPALCLILACGNGSPARVEPQPAAATPALGRGHPPPALEARVDEQVWSYEMLSPEERAVIDRGRDVGGWDRVQRGFADAVRAQAATAPTETGAR